MLSPQAQRRGIPAALALLAVLVAGACGPKRPPVLQGPVTPGPEPSSLPTPQPTPLPTPEALASPSPDAVQEVERQILVSAWAEPAHLPAHGGQAQLLVRVLTPDRRPLAGVEVRFEASAGTIYSQGRLLTTGSNGMTRDRLTTHESTTVTVNAGGTLFRFTVPVGAAP
jgi:hypothetical protein